MQKIRAVLVGGGRMGGAILKGLNAAGGWDAIVVDPNIAEAPGAQLLRDASELPDMDEGVVLLAVKPQMVAGVFAPLRRFAKPGVLIVSIVAGVSLETLRDALGPDARLARAMPNTPAGVLKGVTGVYAAHDVSADQRALCEALLGAVGEVVWLEREGLIDAVTAVSGSGPAYFFRFTEALSAAGAELGFPPDVAERLARATLEGAGALAASTDRSLADLRVEVTSPKGTTAAALAEFDEAGAIQDLVGRAARAAFDRAGELGRDVASLVENERKNG
jgi:pyrroline-5-carboxylate reductase